MGFDHNLVERLITFQGGIRDANHAVDLLIKGPHGWTHTYMKSRDTLLCQICNENKEEHYSAGWVTMSS